MTRPRFQLLLCALVLGTALRQAEAGAAAQCEEPSTPIRHLVVLMQQNHTFDNYFGTYPGADGTRHETCVPIEPANPHSTECVEPFHLGQYPDLSHSRNTFIHQYNGGRMDGFVSAHEIEGQDGTLALGYYDDRDLPYYWNLADEYVLFDRFFSSAHSGSVDNRMYWVAGVSAGGSDGSSRAYPDRPTIFDRLEEKGIEWKFYVRNFDPSLNYRNVGSAGMLEPQVQWLPLLSMDRFIDDPKLSSRIVDMEEFYEDVRRGTLPAVSYVMALGASEHPPSNLQGGQRVTKSMIQALMQSEAWDASAFLLTYDDWGGWYDHVVPPQIDGSGYGFRVPALLVSPYARRGYVDHTELDFASILRFIEDNWGLRPLARRDARANSIAGAFDFARPPREPRVIPWERFSSTDRQEPRRGVIYASYGAAVALAALILAWAAHVAPETDRRSVHPFSGPTGAGGP
ncbi:MAG: alkaline phosphatase family protein [Anaerolineales bacterium]|nr:MAG: alkaline phosphatase family protein [Anaerolineales bacterium]